MACQCWCCRDISRVDRVGIVCEKISNVWHLHCDVSRYLSHFSTIFNYSWSFHRCFWLSVLYHASSTLGMLKCQQIMSLLLLFYLLIMSLGELSS